MVSAIYDTNLLVSAFLSRNDPEGVSNQLLQYARRGAIQLYLSAEIIAETLTTLVNSSRAQRRYRYTASMALEFCESLTTAATILDEPPPTPGAVVRDPNDDKIIACAVAAEVGYIVSRDHDLLSLITHHGILIIAPEQFLNIARTEYGRLRD